MSRTRRLGPSASVGVRVSTVFVTLAATAAVLGSAPSAVGVGPPICFGYPATIVATSDGQTIEGTEENDIIAAGNFLDVRINALGGADKVCGGPGDDTIDGGAGHDELEGRDGEDQIDGGPDFDFIAAGWDSPPLPVPTSGTDTLSGGTGSDILEDDDGDDVLLGGDGDDSIWGKRGHNTIDGGPGRDWLEYVYYPSGPGGSGVVINAATGKVTHPDGLTDDVSGFEMYGGTHNGDRFTGTDGPDWFWGWSGPDHAATGAGDDVIALSGGSVDSGDGDDDVKVVSRGSVDTGAGDDDISVWANDADGDFGWTPGRFDVRGGPGSDHLSMGRASADEPGEVLDIPLRVMFRGGTGDDVFDLGALGRLHVHLADRAARGRWGHATWRSVHGFVGGHGSDYFVGTRHSDSISGGGGRDVLKGRGGADTLLGGRGRDAAYGGSGRDTCAAERRISCERRP